MAPTMMVCALAGFLTARLFSATARRDSACSLATLIGFLIGLSVNFRLPNVLLSAGYFCLLPGRVPDGAKQGNFPARPCVRHRLSDRRWRRRLRRTRSMPEVRSRPPMAASTSRPASERHRAVLLSRRLAVRAAGDRGGLDRADLALNHARQRGRRRCWSRQIWLLNIIFFLIHPLFTPYYTIPISMLSLWTLLFATLKPYGRDGRG